MKKLIIMLATIFLFTNSVQAQHEIGIVAGGLNGISYKYWFNEKTALQTDLAVGLFSTRGKMHINGTNQGINISGVASATYDLYDFTLNPNMVFHLPVWNSLFFYVGGGTSLGLESDILNTDPKGILGKWGLNALTGLEYKLESLPLSFAFDFRPGYAIAFGKQGSTYSQYISLFDWKLAIAVRYCL